MYKFICYLQFILFLFFVYYNGQSNPFIDHFFLSGLLIVVTLLSLIVGKTLNSSHQYSYTASILITLSILIEIALKKGYLPIFFGDYIGIISQFAIAYSGILLFDFKKVPKLFANRKLTKIALMILSWQIVSGVILRGYNKIHLRSGMQTGYLLHTIHGILAIITCLVLLSLIFSIFESSKKEVWYRYWMIALFILIISQILLGIISLISSLKIEQFLFIYNFVRPFHFIVSGLIFCLIILLRKGKG